MKNWIQQTLIAMAAGAVLLGSSTSWAQTGRGLHKKIHAVPVAGKVTVDGKLDDWDLSGQIFSYVVAKDRTIRFLEGLRTWVLARRRQDYAILLGIAGFVLVAVGFSRL